MMGSKQIVLFILLIFSGAAVVIALNPGNLLTPRSTKFTAERFERLKIGDPIQTAIVELGDPIEIEPAGLVGDCANCTVYRFLGDAPGWVVRFDEAWILVNEDGEIAEKITVREP